MTRRPTFSRLRTFTLIALLILAPTLVVAQPLGRAALSVTEGSDAAPNLFSRLWNLLSAALANGSILEPDGASAQPGAGPSAASTGDTGSGLEPNG